MNDDVPVTRRDLDLIVENLSLKISEKVGVKFDQFADRIHQANIERRDSTIQEVTGFPWDERDKVRTVIQTSHQSIIEGADTSKEIKKVIIGYSLPLGIGAAITWFATHFTK